MTRTFPRQKPYSRKWLEALVIKDIVYTQDRFFWATAVLSPPIANFTRDAGYDSVEKFSEWLMLPPQGKKPMEANQMNIIVAGGTNNNYYSIGGLRYMQSVLIDK